MLDGDSFHGGTVPVRVLIADDSDVVRRAICRTLEDDADIQVVGEAPNVAATLRMANELKPQIIVLDLHMPGDDRFCWSFRSQLTDNCRIIAISFADDEETQTLARNIQASVLLEKMALGTELIPTIKKLVS
jgi:two-component system invasion response regulator UvrY